VVLPISGALPSQTMQNSETAGQPAAAQPNTRAVVQNDQAATSLLAQKQLAKKLDETLKNTGFKAEVDNSNVNQVIVRIVDSVTGSLVVQIPSSTSMAIAEALRKGTLDEGQPESGVLLDEAA